MIKRATGWDPMVAEWWPVIAEGLALPWARESVLMDLRWWAARERVDGMTRPGRPTLAKRWGWTDYAVKDALRSEDEWGDGGVSPAERQRTASRAPAERQPVDGSPVVIVEDSPAERQPSASGPPEDRPVRVGSQNTEHRTQTTGETETQDAPAPVAASVSPKAVRGKRQPTPAPTPDDTAAWEACAAAWAEIRPDNARRLTVDKGDGAALMAAIRKHGGPLLVQRIRQAARGTSWHAKAARGEHDGGKRTITSLLWERTKITAELDSAAEDAPDERPTDLRWRDPGWAPTRTAAPPPSRPGQSAPESMSERAIRVAALARKKLEDRDAARAHHRHDHGDLHTLGSRGNEAPGIVEGR